MNYCWSILMEKSNKIGIYIHLSFKTFKLKMYSAKCRPSCLPLDVLILFGSAVCEGLHDDVIKMETLSALLVLRAGNSSHKGQWRGALMSSLICGWINDWVNNRKAGDLRRHLGHYDVNVMKDRNSNTLTLEQNSRQFAHSIFNFC